MKQTETPRHRMEEDKLRSTAHSQEGLYWREGGRRGREGREGGEGGRKRGE